MHLTKAQAYELLELANDITDEKIIQKQFKKLSLKHHPDKVIGDDEAKTAATEKFKQISQARDVLLSVDLPSFDENDYSGQPILCPRCHQAVTPPADAYLFRCPCEAILRNTRVTTQTPSTYVPKGGFVPKPEEKLRALDELVTNLKIPDANELAIVWYCTQCPDVNFSVCCRVNKKKYSCQCGHRVKDHDSSKGYKCSVSNCGCKRVQFHVQHNGWQVRCGCKHKHTDHKFTSKSKHQACTKVLGGKPCNCKKFESTWVCHCGHPWISHKTGFVRNSDFMDGKSREWVAGGVRPELTKIAEKRREKWVKRGSAPATASITAQRQVYQSIPRGKRT